MFFKSLTVLALCLMTPLACFGELPPLKLQSIEGKPISLDTFKGKVLLASNTASLCGFTPQLKDMERAYLQYKDKGFAVLGFPSNDFGEMEPGSNKEIKDFCTARFNITFPLFAKGKIIGPEKQPFFRYLTDAQEEELRTEIEWNFEKFLIDRDGKVRARFGSFINPMSKKITTKIEELLSESA